MNIALVVLSDGRDDYLRQTITSLNQRVTGDITERWLFDDSGDPNYRRDLLDRYPEYWHLDLGTRRGFTQMMIHMWDTLRVESKARWILHLEQDFTFNRPINLGDVTEVMDAHQYMAQMAFKRQPWNQEERDAGGFVEMHPDSYVDQSDGRHDWLEHRRFFTCNPCVYPQHLTNIGWQPGVNTEGHFGLRLFREGTLSTEPEDVRCAFWGKRAEPPWVHHIGVHRAGMGY